MIFVWFLFIKFKFQQNGTINVETFGLSANVYIVPSANILRARICADKILSIAMDFTCQWLGFYLSSSGKISGWNQIKPLALANKIYGSA